MLSIELAKKAYWDNKVEAYITFLNDKYDLKNFCPDSDCELITSMLKKHQFKGKVGQAFAFTHKKENKLVHYIFVGIGKQANAWDKNLEDVRRATGAAVTKLKNLEVASAVMQVPTIKDLETAELIKQMAITSHMAAYKFATFKSEKKKEWDCKVLLSADDGNYKDALETAAIIGDAVNQSRLLCDLPPNVATPTYVSDHAKKLATDITGLKCAVFGRDRAEELGMGGFLAVDVGSEQEGKFVVLEYNTDKKNAPTIALVGKGVTFDSGGISLKPANYMTGMKFDMSGASAVIGAMSIIAQLKPGVNVVGLTPLVENMPSGRANKQDDIITFMNGKTAEIMNTDAEGRLILADALCYAEEVYKPEVIIDVATLTGACLYALGHSFTALMTRNEKLAEKLKESGKVSGDRLWALPLDDDFKPAIKSEVADISNCGTPRYKAGTITAGLFLSNFVKNALEGAAWAHLDIAGTSNDVPDINYLGKGATGVGVRLLADFVMQYKK